MEQSYLPGVKWQVLGVSFPSGDPNRHLVMPKRHHPQSLTSTVDDDNTEITVDLEESLSDDATSISKTCPNEHNYSILKKDEESKKAIPKQDDPPLPRLRPPQNPTSKVKTPCLGYSSGLRIAFRQTRRLLLQGRERIQSVGTPPQVLEEKMWLAVQTNKAGGGGSKDAYKTMYK
ncbi:hypothetical protein JZ751_001245 [Albula glossodonta]|uniref:Uncharacterized protein n=1 Tax=Albula glossodonta TaxID=121402 RepID=A0A8T2PT61_9TELE|nr:hypothetical protein JZ751_001245 [Albula glossodonta]